MIPTRAIKRDRAVVKLSLLYTDALIGMDHDELINLATAYEKGKQIVVSLKEDKDQVTVGFCVETPDKAAA